MATSKIQYRDIVTETYTYDITWTSTSNPGRPFNIDITKDGYTPIGIGYQFTGTGSTYCMLSRAQIDGNTFYGSARMVGNTPTSTTVNSIEVYITYIRN